MDEKEIKRIRKSAMFTAKKRGFKNDAEDISQDVLCKFLQGKGVGQTIDQAVIDQIRTRTKTLESKFTFSELPINKLRTNTHSFDGLHPLEESLMDALHTLYLDPSRRSMFILFYGWGFTMREIAVCFGCSESRVSQVISEIETRLAKSYS